MTSNGLDWFEIIDRLLQTANTLGIDITELKAGEQVEQLRYYTERFSGKRLRQLSPKEVKVSLMELWETFEETLSMRFLLGASTLLQVGQDLTDDQVENLIQSVRDGIEPTLDLTLNKHQFLAKHISNEHPNTVLKLFFFADALSRAFSVPLTHLEAPGQLWHKMDDRHRLIIIVPEREIRLVGDYLIVLGGRNLDLLENYLQMPEPSSGELAQRMRDQVLDSLSPVKWIYFKLKYLTPLHLRVDGISQANDPIAEALYTQLMNLCLIYSADRTKGPADDDIEREGDEAEWRAAFTEQSRTVEIVWNGKTRIPNLDSNRWIGPLAWSDIISFAYGDKIYSFDRLRIIQLTVAHNLEDVEPESSYCKAVSRAPKIQKYAYDLWENFIEGKVKEYFVQLRDVEAAVDTVTEKFQEQVDTLTRTVFENALTAVGVLIGTFIAAAFQDKFNPQIFWIGVVAYLVYLMVFPQWLGLKFSKERFDRTVLAFEKRYTDFKTRLSVTVVDGIVGNVVSEWKSVFGAWSKRAQMIYRIVALLLIVIAILVTLSTSAGTNILVSATYTPTFPSTPNVSETITPTQKTVDTLPQY